MKITTQTDILRSKFSDTGTVDILKEAGFDNIDFSFFSLKDYDVNTDKAEFKKKFTELRKYAEDKGMHFTQAHAPFSSSFADESKNELRFNEIVNSMRNASYLGIKHIVVHPCQHLTYYEEGNKEKATELFKVATKAVDKAANKGVIKDNTASRKKSSLARTLNTL